jgi:hypothetical protein
MPIILRTLFFQNFNKFSPKSSEFNDLIIYNIKLFVFAGVDVVQGVGSLLSKHRRLAASDDDDEDELLVKRTKKYSMTSSGGNAQSQVPSMTSLVPEGQDFKTGDFVVLKEDVERESAPIWR